MKTRGQPMFGFCSRPGLIPGCPPLFLKVVKNVTAAPLITERCFAAARLPSKSTWFVGTHDFPYAPGLSTNRAAKIDGNPGHPCTLENYPIYPIRCPRLKICRGFCPRDCPPACRCVCGSRPDADFARWLCKAPSDPPLLARRGAGCGHAGPLTFIKPCLNPENAHTQRLSRSSGVIK